MNSTGKWVAWLMAAVLIVGLSSCISEDDDDEKKKVLLTWEMVARFVDEQLGEISDGTPQTCNGEGQNLGAGAHCKDQLQGTVTQSTIVQYVEIAQDTVLFNGDTAFYERGFMPVTMDPCFEDAMENFGFGDGLLDYSQICQSGALNCTDYENGNVRLEYNNCQWQQKELISFETLAIADGSTSHYVGALAMGPVVPGSFIIWAYNLMVIDDGLGNLIGDVNGLGNNSIDYVTGNYDVTFSAKAGDGVEILAEYLIESRIWELDGVIDLYYYSTTDLEQISILRTSGFNGTDLTTNATYSYLGDVVHYILINPFIGGAAMGTTGTNIWGNKQIVPIVPHAGKSRHSRRRYRLRRR